MASEARQALPSVPVRIRKLAKGALVTGALSLAACASPSARPGAEEEARAIAPPAAQVEIPAAPVWIPGPAGTGPLAQAPSVDSIGLRLARRALAEHAPKLDALEREGVAQLLDRTEKRHGIPVATMLGLIQQESRFNPRARGPRGSIGLMQIRPFVAADVAARHGITWAGERTLYDPVANVRIGTAYLVEQRERFGTTELALAAYNVGPSRLRKLLSSGASGRGPYVRRVMQKAEALAAEYAAAETAIGG